MSFSRCYLGSTVAQCAARKTIMNTKNETTSKLIGENPENQPNIEDTVRAICLEKQIPLKALAEMMSITRPTLYSWMRTPFWASDAKTWQFNSLLKVDLFSLVKARGAKLAPPENPRRLSSNLAERAKYPPSSFGYVLFDYLLQNNMSVIQLEDKLGCYRNQLHYIAKRKVVIKDIVYNKLCGVSDTFARFFPWKLRQPKLEEHDIKMRDLVMHHYKDSMALEIEFLQQKTKLQQDLFLESQRVK